MTLSPALFAPKPPARSAPLILVLLAIATCIAPAALAAEIYRLPTDVVPTFESIHLRLDPDKADYYGTVRVDLKVVKSTGEIHFHAQDMTLTKVVLIGKKGTVKLRSESGDEGIVTATAPSPIAPGAYTLEIEFTNDFDRRSTGLYRMEIGGHFYSFTQFEAVDARTAFPCWDEPSFKFPYQVTVVVPQAHQAVSNTPIEKESVSKGVKTVVFRRTKPLPSYLLAIATGLLEFVPVPGTSIPTRIVTVKGQTEYAQIAATMTPPLLAALERYFDRPYPYEKLDLIAVPEFTYGAMENPGAITFADHYLLFDPKTMSMSDRRTYAIFAAHEMSHIWYGDLVTMEWWDDLWLNESFASWMGDKISEQVFPELEVDMAALAGTERAMAFDGLLSTRAIRQPIKSMGNLLQSADELAYNKGEAVLEMFEQWMGPETFRRGVLAYLKAHEWGNADASDLWTALSEASGLDVTSAMSTFLEQPGVPLVEADVSKDGSIRFSQRRYLQFGAEAPAPQLWKIPVRFEYFDGKKIRTKAVLLSDAEMTVPIDDNVAPVWVHPNAGESGYYRWYVDPANLQRLADAGENQLTSRERAGFINNAGALLQAGVLRGADYLRLLASFAHDSQPSVIGALPRALGNVKAAFLTPETDESFAAYVRQVLGPSLKHFGMDRAPGEAEAVSLVRPELVGWLADEGHDQAVLARAEEMARSFLADRSSVDPSMVEISLAASAIRGDAALFDVYRTRFEESTVPTDRGPYLQALGNFHAPELRDRALTYALQGPLRPHEVLIIPRAMSGTVAFQGQVFDWMTSNYQTIVGKLPPVYAAYMPYVGSGCDSARLEKEQAFFAISAHQAPGTEIEMARLAERTTDCVSLRDREGPGVARYLSQVAVAK